MVAVINEKIRFHDLRRNPSVNLLVLKYDITLVMLVIYILFLVMDGYLIINRVSEFFLFLFCFCFTVYYQNDCTWRKFSSVEIQYSIGQTQKHK